jgi:hypothetical protein
MQSDIRRFEKYININIFALFFLLATSYLIVMLEIMTENLAIKLWPYAFVFMVLEFFYLFKKFSKWPGILMLLILMFTYYLAPVPYFFLNIPIVPYFDNVSADSYMRTWFIMMIFLSMLCFFSEISRVADGKILQSQHELPSQSLTLKRLATAYWLISILFMISTFTGENILNISNQDNWDIYTDNLKSQSGTLEYFYILFLLGFSLTNKKSFAGILMYLAFFYYLYFAVTRGYRVQSMQMIFLFTILFFRANLTPGKVLFLSVFGFLVLQAIGFMKHGASDFQSLITVMVGDQIRTNQTEVFYTSNNVIAPLFQGIIPSVERGYSLFLAIIATVVPASFLPEFWHTTLSSQNITGLPGGGGGFLAGHFFYWLSYPGIFLIAYLVVKIFILHITTKSHFFFLLSCLLLSTSPRWIAYEPVANFFRLGFYFSFLYFIFYHVIANCRR